MKSYVVNLLLLIIKNVNLSLTCL